MKAAAAEEEDDDEEEEEEWLSGESKRRRPNQINQSSEEELPSRLSKWVVTTLGHQCVIDPWCSGFSLIYRTKASYWVTGVKIDDA